jgi:hypothetical protein
LLLRLGPLAVAAGEEADEQLAVAAAGGVEDGGVAGGDLLRQARLGRRGPPRQLPIEHSGQGDDQRHDGQQEQGAAAAAGGRRPVYRLLRRVKQRFVERRQVGRTRVVRGAASRPPANRGLQSASRRT